MTMFRCLSDILITSRLFTQEILEKHLNQFIKMKYVKNIQQQTPAYILNLVILQDIYSITNVLNPRDWTILNSSTYGARFEQFDLLIKYCVAVLLHKSINLILNSISEVSDDVRCLWQPRLLKMLGLASMHVTHLVTPVTIGRIRHLSRNNKHLFYWPFSRTTEVSPYQKQTRRFLIFNGS